MKILSIETSCDETGIAIVEYTGSDITLVGNVLASQIELHAQYGGVFPAMAKRAHAAKILPLITEALTQAKLVTISNDNLGTTNRERIATLLEREAELIEPIITFFDTYAKPDITYIAVTVGPGLEPALWVGVNVAKILSVIWDIPIIPINHMEGHVVTAAIEEVKQSENFPHKVYRFSNLHFPVLALLVSGGHTELVIAESFGQYQKIGQTRDDAVGEAFDKVARMIGLPYPGGPAVSRLAVSYRNEHTEDTAAQWPILPRPMLHSPDYDFSFSGIKTATLYAIRDHDTLTDQEKMAVACEFENAVVEVLTKKTLKAALEYHTPTIIVGGGVAGNTYLRNQLTQIAQEKIPGTTVLFPEPWLATDNAVMIAMAAMAQVLSGEVKTSTPENLKADGNLSL
jgi:N6-L-threonylcarbamoyladenine synthase